MSKRKNLISIALILLLLVAIAILGSGLLRQTRLNESSREFAIYVTPLLLSAESQDQGDIENPEELAPLPTVAEIFADLAHPSLLEQQSIEGLASYFYTVTRNLGRLQLIESITGSSEVPLLELDRQTPQAAYQLEVEFSGGTAQVEIEMLFEQDEWRITAFEVKSTLLSD